MTTPRYALGRGWKWPGFAAAVVSVTVLHSRALPDRSLRQRIKLTMLNLQFRPACADDLEHVIDLIYSSGPEAFEYGFSCPGRPAREFLRFAFAQGHGLFGWGNHRVVVCADQVIAVGSFFSAKEYPRLSNAMIKQVLQFFPLRYWPQVIRRALHLKQLLPPPDPGQQYIANLGVRPDFRGQGVGAALLEQEHRRAQAKGLHYCALDVAESNPRAQALYARLGYAVTARNRFPGPATKVPNARRMVLPLQAE